MLKLRPTTVSGLGGLIAAGAVLTGCSCQACYTEPPPVIRMDRQHAELERSLRSLAGRSEALLHLTQSVRAGEEPPPDALRALRLEANGLNLRIETWLLGSSALFQSESFMGLPPVDSPLAEPPRVDDVQIVESNPKRFYAALEKALPLLREKSGQIEDGLATFLEDPNKPQK